MRAWVLVAAMGLRATTASAQQPDAVHWLEEGARLRAARRDVEALAAFERAWEGCHCDEATVQRGLAEQALGRWGEAAERLDGLDASTDAWVVRNVAHLREARAVIARHVGTLDVRVDVPDAQLDVAGRPRGAVAGGVRPLRVDAGDVALRVEADGRVVRRVVHVEPGGVVRVDVVLTPPREAMPEVVPTPSVAPSVATAEAIVPRRVALPARRSRAPWVWGLSGGAGLALAGGVVGLVARNDALTGYNDPSCVTVFASREERCGALRRAAEVDEALAVTGFVVGGVAVVVAAVVAVTDRRERPTRAWWCGPTGVRGAGCGGVF